jgi:hypothetical protein
MVTQLAEVASIQKKQAEKVVTELVAMIKGLIVKGERIALPGLGTFSTTAHSFSASRSHHIPDFAGKTPNKGANEGLHRIGAKCGSSR